MLTLREKIEKEGEVINGEKQIREEWVEYPQIGGRNVINYQPEPIYHTGAFVLEKQRARWGNFVFSFFMLGACMNFSYGCYNRNLPPTLSAEEKTFQDIRDSYETAHYVHRNDRNIRKEIRKYLIMRYGKNDYYKFLKHEKQRLESIRKDKKPSS